MFAEHQEDVQSSLVGSKDMFSAVPGFFSSLSHTETHFEWLTEKNIASSIVAQLPRQFEILKCVVAKISLLKEFIPKFEISKIKSLQLIGSITPQLVCLLCQLNLEWHNTAGGLFRFPSEPENDSPHIFCPDGISSIKFDLHIEKKKIISRLNFTEIMRAFFSIAFIGNLTIQKLAKLSLSCCKGNLRGSTLKVNLFVLQT